MVRLAVAEDNYLLSKSLEEKIGFFNDLKLKHIAPNGKYLIDWLEKDANIEVILMDIQMPLMDGIEATAIIKKRFPHIKIIMLTVFDDDENIYNAFMAGANGYLLKDTDPQSLFKGIQDVLEGGASMTPSIAFRTIQILRNPSQIGIGETEDFQLTNREQEILEQIATGLNYHEISANLSISPSTVRKHIENIYKKLNVHNKMEAVDKAKKNKLL